MDEWSKHQTWCLRDLSGITPTIILVKHPKTSWFFYKIFTYKKVLQFPWWACASHFVVVIGGYTKQDVFYSQKSYTNIIPPSNTPGGLNNLTKNFLYKKMAL